MDGEIIIQDGQVESEAAEGALEESMIHETVHTSLDELWEDHPQWIAAKRQDGG